MIARAIPLFIGDKAYHLRFEIQDMGFLEDNFGTLMTLFDPQKFGYKTAAKFILVSSGSPSITLALTQPDRNIPDYAYLHFYMQKLVRGAARPETVVIGGAYSVFRNGQNKFLAVKREESSFVYWANKNIKDGVCDMAAVGRQSLADSTMPAKLEAGKENEIDWCTCCDNCIELLIRQLPVGCTTYDKEYSKILADVRKKAGRLAEKHT